MADVCERFTPADVARWDIHRVCLFVSVLVIKLWYIHTLCSTVSTILSKAAVVGETRKEEISNRNSQILTFYAHTIWFYCDIINLMNICNKSSDVAMRLNNYKYLGKIVAFSFYTNEILFPNTRSVGPCLTYFQLSVRVAGGNSHPHSDCIQI